MKWMIRQAQDDDVDALARLMEALGYRTSEDEMRRRWFHIRQNKQFQTYVAVAEQSQTVIGMIGTYCTVYYQKSGLHAQVQTLVVDAHYRGTGVGKSLLAAAEEWARQQGAEYISLNSGQRLERQLAHEFYRRQGYQGRSVMKFSKSLKQN